MSKSSFDSPLQYAVMLLSQRSYTEKKMREKLVLRDYIHEEIEATIAKLKEKHYIDDRLFAEDYIKLRVARKPKAAEAFIRELVTKGISFDLAREVVTQYCTSEDEVKVAKEYVEQKQAQFAMLPVYERDKKLAGLLARRGFRPDTIRAVLSNLDSDND